MQIPLPHHAAKKRKALFLLVLGVVLLVIGVASLFALQGKSIQFDRNYDILENGPAQGDPSHE